MLAGGLPPPSEKVLPENLKNLDVVDQLAGEYEWTLAELRERDLA